MSESVSTATGLVSSTGHQEQSLSRVCLFCEKKHESSDCYKAAKMSLEEKSKIVREKKGCYVCLKVGHFSRNCKSMIHCQVCGKKHFVVMCPELT